MNSEREGEREGVGVGEGGGEDPQHRPLTLSAPHPLRSQYIKSELDELEREEFFRLKRSQDKKKAILKAKAVAEAAAAEAL